MATKKDKYKKIRGWKTLKTLPPPQPSKRKILDQITKLVDPWASSEIQRLRALIREYDRVAAVLYKEFGSPCGKWELPHEVEDFLQWIGDGSYES